MIEHRHEQFCVDVSFCLTLDLLDTGRRCIPAGVALHTTTTTTTTTTSTTTTTRFLEPHLRRAQGAYKRKKKEDWQGWWDDMLCNVSIYTAIVSIMLYKHSTEGSKIPACPSLVCFKKKKCFKQGCYLIDFFLKTFVFDVSTYTCIVYRILCGITRRWIDVCLQSWCNPVRFTN